MQNFENTFESEQGYELAAEFSNEGETYELSPEFQETSYEFMNEGEFINEVPVYEISAMETELAFELGTVSNEQELSQFIKGLGQKALGAASNFLNSPTGQNLTSKLTDIAKKTIPSVAKNVGSKVLRYGAEQLGSAIDKRTGRTGLGKDILGYAGQQLGGYGGEQLGNAASNKVVGFIRFATDAIRNAAGSNPAVPPTPVTNNAIIQAAKKYYPQILRRKSSSVCPKCHSVNREANYENEFLNETSNESEYQQELNSEINSEGIFNEVAEMQLATELLSITNEQELDMFLGGLLKKAAGAVKTFAKSSAGKALGGILKNVAKKALPIAGSALGNFILPGVGGMIGGKLASMATNLFEIQGETLSQEDREFEVARRFVRFAGNAARRASRMSTNLPPRTIANRSITDAAKRYAPGLTRGGWNDYLSDNSIYDPNYQQNQSGSWFRQGNSIVIRGI
jgi:hypothetical protein